MKKLLIILILTVSISLFAQYDLSLTATVPQPVINVLYPANFNPDEPSMQPNIFMITLNGAVPDNAVLHCKMTWEDESALVTLTPDSPGAFPSTINSEDIINNSPNGFSVDQTFDDFLDNIEDLIIDTGRMPDGNYVFELGIYEQGHEGDPGYLLSNLVTVVITIRSPISISLITPGNPIGLGVTNISEQYPNFIWFSNLGDYTIKIYELDGVYDTVEEIEMLDPYYVENGINGTSFSYPPSAPVLEYNKTYAWQVNATTISPNESSQSVYKSTMYLFRLSDSNSQELGLQILINFLNQLGITGVDEVIGLLESGYTIESIIWEGNEIVPADLMNILEDISNGEYTPTQITVE